MSLIVEKEIGGRKLVIETGKLAKQATGSALVRYGDTVILATVVSAEKEEDPGFFPLTVEYKEKAFAAGKIPGGFYKREGRPTTKEILTMRLIDRPLRPLFPKGFRHEVQVTVNVFSADRENDSDIVAMIGASAAISCTNLPFGGPIGAVRVGRIRGELILNPTYSQLQESDMDLVVAGTDEAIIMVEGEGKEIPEQEMIDAIFWAHEQIKPIVEIQKEIAQQVPKEDPVEIPPAPPEEEIAYNSIKEKYFSQIKEALFSEGKKNRGKAIKEIYKKIKEEFTSEDLPEEQRLDSKFISVAYDKIQGKIVREGIKEGKRVDGRSLADIRDIECEVGFLPRTHGSAVFTRGETQAFVSVTLGTSLDEQVIDGLLPEHKKRFILHYNFPPFCVGEVRPFRGISRREIGHGNLAERALEQVLPDNTRFPYTIRLVSEVLESNGSSSMASVCAGTLALMDAGTPIKKPVGGIAMGLVKEDDEFYVISDILGTEDHYGDMDFKVTGTPRGITALQMDMKIQGINKDILTKSLEQAKEGRIHILREMVKALPRPRKDISEYAPRIIRLNVNPDKIGAIIGSGGKTIRHIQETTGATIEISETGLVSVYCNNSEGALQAQQYIERLTEEVEVGKIYTGKVTAVKDFGAFVEIAPGLEGLVHVSELEKNFVQDVGEIVKLGQEITVKVLAVDDQNRIKLSKRAAERDLNPGQDSSRDSSNRDSSRDSKGSYRGRKKNS